MRTLICGSMAYDNIMLFQDYFKNHILPEKVHMLNVAFLVPEMRRELGGCAGNIAYNLHLLGGEPLIMATVGNDFAPYQQRLSQLKINTCYISMIENSFTGQAFITTDLADNQITAFHPGAMSYSHQNKIADTRQIGLAIVSPDGKQGMQEHARDLAAAKIPFIFDPGQGLPMFDGEELKEFIALADYIAVNDYEAELLQSKTGFSLNEIAQQCQALIVTRGDQGSWIYHDGQRTDVPCVAATRIQDPTGCGDAYRAGLLYGIAQGWSWLITGRIAAILAAIKIAHKGGQNHHFDYAQVAQHYQSVFGEALPASV